MRVPTQANATKRFGYLGGSVAQQAVFQGLSGQSDSVKEVTAVRLPDQSAGVQRALITRAARAGIVSSARRYGAPGRALAPLRFGCDSLLCGCSGDDDCNDMFSSDLCSGIAVCDETGGRVRCVCIRQDVVIPA